MMWGNILKSNEIISNVLSIKSRLKLRKVIVFIPPCFPCRTNKRTVARSRKRKFREVRLPEGGPPQPCKRRKIENEGQRLVEKSDKSYRQWLKAH